MRQSGKQTVVLKPENRMLQSGVSESLHAADGLWNEEFASADSGLVQRKLLSKNQRI